MNHIENIKNDKAEILVVEDSPTQLMKLKHFLEQKKFLVSTAQNGLEALKLLKKRKPKVVISDIVMPEMGGFELCRKIKADETLKDIPVILLTDLSEPEDIMKGLESGAENFVTKPYDIKFLLSRINYVIVNREMRKKSTTEMGIDVFFAGQRHFITSDRLQILDLLISTYEITVQKSRELEQANKELKKAQGQLKTFNEQLEKKVIERTQRISDLNRMIHAVRNVNQLIAKEKDRDRLLRGICDSLIKNRSNCNAWIVLLDDAGEFVTSAQAGLGKKFLPLKNQLKSGKLTTCCRRALKQPGVTVIEDPASTCSDCLLAGEYGDRAGIAVRMEHGGKVYGLLVSSVAKECIKDQEEKKLFEEVAGDIGFAIYSIKLEEERKRINEALQRSERELSIRNKIANIFLTIADDEMYTEVLKVFLEAMESRFGVFGFIDENGASVIPSMTRHIWDKCQMPQKTFVFPRDTWGDSTWARALREKKVIFSNEPSTNIPKGHISILRHISFPIIHLGEVIGLLQVANKETDYNEMDIQLMETIANQIAPTLNARLQRDRRERESKQAEKRQELSFQILEKLNRQGGSHDEIREILELVKAFTGFEAIGIRLRQGEDFPYFVSNGFPGDFIEAENYLCATDKAGEIIRDSNGNPYLECMCGNILCGRTDPALPFFTKGGSFWTNGTTKLLASTTEKERQTRTRTRCNRAGYESVALIPLRSGKAIIGLLQFNDFRPDCFTLEMIQFFEGLGTSIGIALDRKRMQEALQYERDFLDRIMETNPSGIFMIDPQGKVIFTNPRAAEIMGLKKGKTVKKSFEETKGLITDPGDNPIKESRLCYRKVMASGQPIYDVRYAVKWQERDRALISVSSAPVFDDSSQVSGVVCTVEDITSRTLTEKQLEKSEEAYRQLYDNAPVGYHELDREGKIVRVNRAECEMFGYLREEMLGRPVFDFIAPEEREKYLKAFLAKIAGRKKIKPFEIKYLRQDGTCLECLIEENLILDDRSRVIGIRTTIQDISDLKKAEKALHRSLEMEKLVAAVSANFINLPYFEFDREINETLKKIGEFAGAERSYLFLVSEDGQNMDNTHEWCAQGIEPKLDNLKVIPTTEIPWWMEKLNRFENVLVPRVTELPKKAGAEKKILQAQAVKSLMVVPIVSKNTLVGFLGLDSVSREKSWEDKEITLLKMIGATFANAIERKRSGEIRRLLQTAIDQAAEYILITDTKGKIVYVNATFEKITGYTMEEALGQSPKILKSGNHDQAFYRDLWQTITSGRVWRGRFVNKKKDGSLYHEEATISPVRDFTGAIVNFVAVKHDITQQLELENQFRQTQKMESIGLLAGGVAHDFNNILTSIMGYSSLIVRDKSLPEKLIRRVLEIEKASQRGAEITSHLLTFSRKKPPKLEQINLNDNINQTLRMLGKLLGPNITIERKLAADLKPVSADGTQLQQVLMNLCINSRDAMPGGGTISIETFNFDIDAEFAARYTYANTGPHIVFSVSDTGTGMDAETRSRIFEPFFTTKETGKGTGLGMSIVYGIVKNHGGFINLYSDPGLGTTIKIYLPQSTEKFSRKEEAKPVIRGGDEKILVVDDEEMILRLASNILEDYGYTCLTADNGAEALELYRKDFQNIDLVLLDMVMPRMSGMEVFEKLQEINPRVVAVMSSGFSLTDSDAIMQKGVTDFVAKPYRESDLAGKIREVLDAQKKLQG